MNKHELKNAKDHENAMINSFLSIAEEHFRGLCDDESWAYFIMDVERLRPMGYKTSHDKYGVYNPDTGE